MNIDDVVIGIDPSYKKKSKLTQLLKPWKPNVTKVIEQLQSSDSKFDVSA